MKTILSLIALATLIGILPFALGESKTAKTTKARSAATTEKMAAAPSAESTVAKTPAKAPAATQETKKAASKVAAPKRTSAKTAAKSKAVETPAESKTAASKSVPKSPLTPAQEDKLLTLLNEGTVEELVAIPGVAATRADSIVSARPYASIHEIIQVDGVGNATFEKILSHGKLLTQRASATVEGTSKS